MFAAAACIVAMTGCSKIDTGEVGVVKTFNGTLEMQELPPGIHFTGLSKVSEFTTKEIQIQVRDLKPKARDRLFMADVDVDIYVQAAPGKVADTVAKYQSDVTVKDGVGFVGFTKVSREAREAVNNSVAKFDSTTMHTMRPAVGAEIAQELQKSLDQSDPGAWIVTAASAINLLPDPALETATRAAAEMDLRIAKAEKDKLLAEADAATAKARALGEAKANEIVSASLTPMLLQARAIEAQKAFAGAGTHTVMLGGSSQALVNVGK
jgi:regulator of protease activity HflC (stomatin/prohibitin superfamily)